MEFGYTDQCSHLPASGEVPDIDDPGGEDIDPAAIAAVRAFISESWDTCPVSTKQAGADRT